MQHNIKQIEKWKYIIPKYGDMLVDAIIFGNKNTIKMLIDDTTDPQWDAVQQLKNIASLPGIQKYSIGLADIHPGYGFPIGGIGAFDYETGIITVAGVGFDCNCGVRTLYTNAIDINTIIKNAETFAHELYRAIPAGLGSIGDIKYTVSELDLLLNKGVDYLVQKGFGLEEDLLYIEDNGCLKGANPDMVSELAKKRQLKQIGTLGSGNHYLEIQKVEDIYDKEKADIMNISEDTVIISIHCGSRALGHQIGSDYIKIMEKASKKYKLPIYHKELVGAPIQSEEGQNYIAALNCGINAAFANRQMLTHLLRESFKRYFSIEYEDLKILYDVGHNTAKIENHSVGGIIKKLVVHRKGSTRAFGPDSPGIPDKYKTIGQPVLVGGSMGTSSYILTGTKTAMEKTFGSAIHGAGRLLSRKKAKMKYNGKNIMNQLKNKGIHVKCRYKPGVAEEAPGVYKDVDDVIDVSVKAGIVNKVVRLSPIICIKG